MVNKAIPRSVKQQTGAIRRNKQRQNPKEAVAPEGAPRMPPHIAKDAVAKGCWQRLCKTLDTLKLLFKTDRDLLELYCVTYAEWIALGKEIRGGKVEGEDSRGNAVLKVHCNQYHKHAQTMRLLMGELGLTPSSRARLQANVETDEDDPFSELMSRMGRG